MTNDKQPNRKDAEHQNDMLTLRDIILGLQEFVVEVWRKGLWVVLAGLLVGLLFLYQAWVVPIRYEANLTFMVDQDDAGANAGVGSILGQLGLSVGGAGNEYNLDQVLALSQSGHIVRQALFDTLFYDSGPVLVANRIIDVYNFHEHWAKSKNTNIHGYYLKKGLNDTLSRLDRKALKKLSGKVTASPNKEGLSRVSYDFETNIMEIKVITEDELLSLRLAELLYENLSDYYVAKSTEKQSATLQRIKSKKDSLYLELQRVEYRLARINDRAENIIGRTNRLEQDKLSRESRLLSVIYAETLKNQETAQFVLDNATPFFQVVEQPETPLSVLAENIIFQFIFGLILGGMIAVFIVIVRKVIVDALRE